MLRRNFWDVFRPNIGHFRQNNCNWNFKNMRFWSFLAKFGQILETFFFQNEILVQNCPEMTKNDFRHLLWILKMIFIHFRVKFDNLKFWLFQIFYIVIPSWKTEMSQHGFIACFCPRFFVRILYVFLWNLMYFVFTGKWSQYWISWKNL